MLQWCMSYNILCKVRDFKYTEMHIADQPMYDFNTPPPRIVSIPFRDFYKHLYLLHVLLFGCHGKD